ncbi:hypothetical protein R4R82_001121 [Enterobacter asburiae]|nr:hypothetical protein [Enterobacter asburiae]
MSTITREWLQQKIAEMEAARDEIPFGLDEDDSNTLAALRIALASPEAEPVAWRYRTTDINGNPNANWSFSDEASLLGLYQPLYTAPPSPVVPEEATPENIAILASIFAPRGVTYQWDRDECNAAADSWNACRAAMRQGAEQPQNQQQNIPENIPTLRDGIAAIRNSGIAIDAEKILAERDALNAPGCWCRTCRPITMTDMRFVVCPECGNKRCPHANDHRNACTASNEPGQEGSAYPAAPQQEAE